MPITNILKKKPVGTTSKAGKLDLFSVDSKSGPYSHANTSDICPVCRKEMTRARARGIPVNFCLEHRISMPVQG